MKSMPTRLTILPLSLLSISHCRLLSLRSISHCKPFEALSNTPTMTTTMTTKTTHIDRTAHEPRDNSLHTLLITTITQITPTIRLFHLSPPPSPSPQPITFLPGQWIDLYHPPFPPHQKPGGFTITSPPSSLPHHLELAIQSSPSNPPAAYLWQEPPESLLNTPVKVRIGGSFTYPPPPSSITFKKVIFVAGGVGINPIMSMLSHIASLPVLERREKEVAVLYGMKDSNGDIAAGSTSQALFLDRISGLFAGENGLRGEVKLFLTGSGPKDDEVGAENQITQAHGVQLPFTKRRIGLADLEEAIGAEKDQVAVYICGVPSMTDELVEGLTLPAPKGLGMDERRVLCEKWW